MAILLITKCLSLTDFQCNDQVFVLMKRMHYTGDVKNKHKRTVNESSKMLLLII